MIKKLINNKYVIMLVILMIFILLGFFALFSPHFFINDFNGTIEVDYLSKEPINLSGCYGTYFICHAAFIKQVDELDTSVLGEHKIKFVFSYKNKEIEDERVIKVVDRQSPTITVNGDTFKYCPNGKLDNYDVKVEDNYDGDITRDVNIFVENDKLVFEATDSSGNKSQIMKDVLKIDEEQPSLKLNGDSTISIEVGSTYNELGAVANDNCDGDLTDKIVITGTVDNQKVGQYTINYKVSDTSGLSSEVNRKVIVYEKKVTKPSTPSYSGNGKTIYLTFDDGPSSQTGRLLDVLKKYNVKATFFVTNQRSSYGYDNMIKRAYDEGHTIGLHSNSHVYSQIYTSIDNYYADLYAIQKKVERITGYTSKIVRFPGGSSNTVSKNYDGGIHIMSALSKSLHEKGFKYYDWNVSSGDAGETTNTSVVARNVIKSLGTKNVYVVLQHDIYGFSVNAVETIIQYGLEHGYQFKNITMDTPEVHHSINN